jgi:hypothetical protein
MGDDLAERLDLEPTVIEHLLFDLAAIGRLFLFPAAPALDYQIEKRLIAIGPILEGIKRESACRALAETNTPTSFFSPP